MCYYIIIWPVFGNMQLMVGLSSKNITTSALFFTPKVICVMDIYVCSIYLSVFNYILLTWYYVHILTCTQTYCIVTFFLSMLINYSWSTLLLFYCIIWESRPYPIIFSTSNNTNLELMTISYSSLLLYTAFSQCVRHPIELISVTRALWHSSLRF